MASSNNGDGGGDERNPVRPNIHNVDECDIDWKELVSYAFPPKLCFCSSMGL